MVDPLFVLTAVLLSLTITTTILYYRRIRAASKVYEEAKTVVGDIAISFDRQLQSHEEQLQTAIQKVEAQTLKTERLSRRFDEQESRVSTSLTEMGSKAVGLSDLETIKGDLEGIKKQMKDLATAQEQLKEQATALPESQIETAIPIRRERALAPLTETELHVLESIAASGEKTAPEIKEMIKLTREHTARLMKKLYEEGYLERRSEKTPYTYRVKEEMLEILKKREVNA